MRILARKAGHQHIPDYIEKVAHACVLADETLMRVLYYDCAPFGGEVALPVSNGRKKFDGSAGWLSDLTSRDLIAVRLGVLKFRGWQPNSVPVAPKVPTDDDFKPRFEQKGVDMRIGLDVANFAEYKSVDRVAFITNDTDCVPAFKHARKCGLQVVLIAFPNQRGATELRHHSDFERRIAWPAP